MGSFLPLRSWLLGALALAASCVSDPPGSYYVHPNADLSRYERVAVLPLGNLTTDRFAHERVREVINVELAALGAFQVVELGEVNRVLRQMGVADVRELDADQVAALGSTLAVQALLEGTVMEYRERRSGSFTVPELALSLSLIDVESAVPVCSVTDGESGLALRTRLFGVGERTQSDVARELVRRIVIDLFAIAGA